MTSASERRRSLGSGNREQKFGEQRLKRQKRQAEQAGGQRDPALVLAPMALAEGLQHARSDVKRQREGLDRYELEAAERKLLSERFGIEENQVSRQIE